MKIEKTSHMKATYSVSVDAGELIVDSGKALPYGCTIGLISHDTVTVWMPAAYRPRGYRAAALRLLTDVRDSMFVTDSTSR